MNKTEDPANIISIIIPVYNASQTIGRTLNSLLIQTYKHIEILCIDDGSSDNSLDIIKEFGQKDSRIKVLTQTNSGPASARNNGLRNATGNYLMFCDSDDWYEPQMCDLMLRTMIQHDVDLVVCDVNQCIESDENRPALDYTSVDFLGYLELTDSTKKYVRKSLWNKIFRRSIVTEYGINFPDGYEHDDSTFIRLYTLVAQKNAYGIADRLYNYAVRQGSIMWHLYNNPKNDKIFDCCTVLSFFFDFLTKHNLWDENLIFTKEELWGTVTFHYWIVPDKHQLKLLKMYSELLNRPDVQIPLEDDELSQNLYALKEKKYLDFSKKLQPFKPSWRSPLKSSEEGKIMNILKTLFSAENDRNHKIITLAGIKIKLKSKFLQMREHYNHLQEQYHQLLKENQQQNDRYHHLLEENQQQNDRYHHLLEEHQQQQVQYDHIHSQYEQLEVQRLHLQEQNHIMLEKINFLEEKTKPLPGGQSWTSSITGSAFDELDASKFEEQWGASSKRQFTFQWKEIVSKIRALPNPIEAYRNFCRGLDDHSAITASRMLAIMDSDEKNLKYILTPNEYEAFMEKIIKVKTGIFKITDDCYAFGKYLLPWPNFPHQLFCSKHGLDTINLSKIPTDSVIIDVGAFIGDSAMIFRDYVPNKIYSFEPMTFFFNMLKKTIELNQMQKQVTPVNLALTDDKERVIYAHETATMEVSDTPNGERLPCDTLDDYVIKNNLKVGLIKVDIEGGEQAFLAGAKETICRDKPILLLSIYHYWSELDFFKLKEIIESWNLEYTFKIFKPLDDIIMVETLLICEQA